MLDNEKEEDFDIRVKAAIEVQILIGEEREKKHR